MEAVLLLLKHGADVNAIADQRHDYRTVSDEKQESDFNQKRINGDNKKLETGVISEYKTV